MNLGLFRHWGDRFPVPDFFFFFARDSFDLGESQKRGNSKETELKIKNTHVLGALCKQSMEHCLGMWWYLSLHSMA